MVRSINWFSTLKRLKVRDAVLVAFVILALLLFLPERMLRITNVDWSLGLFVALPATFVFGLLSTSLYYRNHDFTSIDPTYIRAWGSIIAGVVTWPVCLIFRPSVAGFAFIMLPFGAGSVVAFHVQRRILKRVQIHRRIMKPD